MHSIFKPIFMIGMLLGSLIIAPLSDKIGRKKSIIMGLMLSWIGGLINAFGATSRYGDSAVALAFGRIIASMGDISVTMITSVFLMECTNPNHRNTLSQTNSFVIGVLGLLLPLEAYYIRDTFELQIALSGPIILAVIPALFMKESTRWLISKGRLEEAKKNIYSIAKLNGITKPADIDIVLIPKSTEGPKTCVKELFKHKVLIIRLLMSCFQWFMVTATFYGATYSAAEVSASPYLSVAIGFALQIPQPLVSFYLNDRLGRKKSLALTKSLAGICLIMTGISGHYIEIDALEIMFVSLAQFFGGMAFSLDYLYTSEMYPTSLRATVFGICSVVGRLGGMYGLGIGFTSKIWKPLPFVLTGGPAILTGLAALWFPETTGCPLPDTIEEAINNVGKNPKLEPWCSSNKNIAENDTNNLGQEISQK